MQSNTGNLLAQSGNKGNAKFTVFDDLSLACAMWREVVVLQSVSEGSRLGREWEFEVFGSFADSVKIPA